MDDNNVSFKYLSGQYYSTASDVCALWQLIRSWWQSEVETGGDALYQMQHPNRHKRLSQVLKFVLESATDDVTSHRIVCAGFTNVRPGPFDRNVGPETLPLLPFTRRCLATPSCGCPATYCGTVGPYICDGPVRPISLNSS